MVQVRFFPDRKKVQSPFRIFPERNPPANQSRVHQPNFPPTDFLSEFSNGCDLLIGDPHHARIPRATVATLSAGELKTILIPGGVFRHEASLRNPHPKSNQNRTVHP